MRDDKYTGLDFAQKLNQAYLLLTTDPAKGRKLASELVEMSRDFEQVAVNERAKYIILSSYYMLGDVKNLQRLVEMYWRELKDYNNELFKAELYKFQAIYLFLTRQAEEAQKSIEDAINIYDKNNENVKVIHCYLVKATIYYSNFEVVKAFKTYDLFIDSCEDFPEIDSSYSLTALNNMSSLFMNVGDYNEALNLILGVSDLIKKSDKENFHLLFTIYLNTATCHVRLGNLSEVPVYLERAEKIICKLGAESFMAALNGIWAEYYYQKEDYVTAEKYAFLTTKGKVQTKGNEFIDADEFVILYCAIVSKLGRYNEVKDLLESGIKVIEQVGIDYKAEISYEKLAELYNSEGLYKEASLYFTKWKEMRLKLKPVRLQLLESKMERREKLESRREEYRLKQASN